MIRFSDKSIFIDESEFRKRKKIVQNLLKMLEGRDDAYGRSRYLALSKELLHMQSMIIHLD